MDLDLESLFTLSYGVYVLSSRKGGKANGQISNAVMQVTDDPPRLAVAVNRGSLTHEYIVSSGVFGVTVLSERAPLRMIGLFGFRSGRDVDKLAEVASSTGVTGCPIVTEHALACAEAKVTGSLECGTHTVFVGEVVGGRRMGAGRPMTYAYYREVLRGKTPPTAPTYRASAAASVPVSHKDEQDGQDGQDGRDARRSPSSESCTSLSDAAVARAGDERKGGPAMKKYVCKVCGYVYDPAKGDPESGVEAGIAFDDLPDDWVCPVCGAGKDEFEVEE